MSTFTIHTVDTAPNASKPLLHSAKKGLGFIPNLYAVFAQSPATLEAYQVLSELFDKTAFTITERQLILLSNSRFRNCSYCLAAHGTAAKMQNIAPEIIAAVYFNQVLEDSKLEALRSFTRAVLASDGWVDDKVLDAFFQAGYQKQHVLEVILGISFKTLSNYVNHINDTPIDTQFLAGIPDSKHAVANSIVVKPYEQ